MKFIYPEKEYCMGCRLCEIACLTSHSVSQDVFLAYTKERCEGLAPRKTVYEDGHVCIALSCRHCDEPACVAACISGALFKDEESGRTEYDRDRCVGCWSCLVACPYGAIRRDHRDNKIFKCDLCKHRETPACVEACPNQALHLKERKE